MDLNVLAEEITSAEGLKTPVSIAQIKEIIGIFGDRWRNMCLEDAENEFYTIRNRAGLRASPRP